MKKKIVFKEDIGEQFCICRRGDDSVNYMIQCDHCKEWYHGKCIGLNKTLADSLGEYVCICCARRKDGYNYSYHEDFFNLKRYSYNNFCQTLEDPLTIQIEFPQMEYLLNEKNKIIVWEEKYKKMLHEIHSFYLKGNHFLSDEYDKLLCNLYLEMEGFCVEVPSGYNIILILKQSDWFKEVAKLFENSKKFNERTAKKILANSYSLFNSEFASYYYNEEKTYFTYIYQKGINSVKEISNFLEKGVSSGFSNMQINFMDKGNSGGFSNFQIKI